jgi:hypothetical protein
MHVIGMPSEGRRSADYERGSRRSKKQIFHDTVLSFGRCDRSHLLPLSRKFGRTPVIWITLKTQAGGCGWQKREAALSSGLGHQHQRRLLQ